MPDNLTPSERRTAFIVSGFWHTIGGIIGLVMGIGAVSIIGRLVRALVNCVTYLWGIR